MARALGAKVGKDGWGVSRRRDSPWPSCILYALHSDWEDVVFCVFEIFSILFNPMPMPPRKIQRAPAILSSSNCPKECYLSGLMVEYDLLTIGAHILNWILIEGLCWVCHVGAIEDLFG